MQVDKLYKLIGIMLFAIAFTMPAMAESPYPVGDDVFVKDHYKNVVQQIPYQILLEMLHQLILDVHII